MVHVEDRHYEIIKAILEKHPYSFYAFGSRVKGDQRHFSDLDLCFAGDIPWQVISQINGDFSESNLPYKIDIIDLQTCSADFRKLIRKDLVCIQANQALFKIEENTFKHFRYLPKLLGYDIKHMHGCEIIDFSPADSMVYGADFAGIDPDSAISDICNILGNKPFAWWLGASAQPRSLGTKLATKGFINETTEYAMIRELDFIPESESALTIKLAEDTEDFLSVLSVYDAKSRYFYEKLDPSRAEEEKLFVGYEKGVPVTIGMVCFDKDTAGIFSLVTTPGKIGKGYGTAMMLHLMGYSKSQGKKYASLIASSDAGLRIYKKLGFVSQGLVECYEWKIS